MDLPKDRLTVADRVRPLGELTRTAMRYAISARSVLNDAHAHAADPNHHSSDGSPHC